MTEQDKSTPPLDRPVSIQIAAKMTLDQLAEMLVISLQPDELLEVIVAADEKVGTWGFTLRLIDSLLDQLHVFAQEDKDTEMVNAIYLLHGMVKREARSHD